MEGWGEVAIVWITGWLLTCYSTLPIFPIDPLHVRGNAANLGDRTIRFIYMRIDLKSQKRKLFIWFCPPDWLHSHDVQRVYWFRTTLLQGMGRVVFTGYWYFHSLVFFYLFLLICFYLFYLLYLKFLYSMICKINKINKNRIDSISPPEPLWSK